jgi:hypothetical protein
MFDNNCDCKVINTIHFNFVPYDLPKVEPIVVEGVLMVVKVKYNELRINQ